VIKPQPHKAHILIMTLVKNVDPDVLIEGLRHSDDKIHNHHAHQKNAGVTLTPYSSRYNAQVTCPPQETWINVDWLAG
jgi:hypothetical protein